jgi:hypothetical protein
MNNFYLKPPPINNTLPHLIYMNLKTITHNKIVYKKTLGETFKFLVEDILFPKMSSFQIINVTISHRWLP